VKPRKINLANVIARKRVWDYVAAVRKTPEPSLSVSCVIEFAFGFTFARAYNH